MIRREKPIPSLEDLRKEWENEVGDKPSESDWETDIKKFLDEGDERERRAPLSPVIKPIKGSGVVGLNGKLNTGLNDDIVLAELQNGLNPVGIAEKYGCSKPNISYFIGKLISKDLVFREGKEIRVKGVVKDLALSTSLSRDKYQLQTIQITIPITNPGIIDTVKWDKVLDNIGMKILRLKKWKATIRRQGKDNPSIIVSLWERWIDSPEDVKKLCMNYVEYLESELLKHDIRIDKDKARAGGLQIWKRDEIVPENYDKSEGVIGVYHGVDACKIFDNDKVKERKTWVDGTPSPDGIESNDQGYFIDKDTMEVFVGRPKSGRIEEGVDLPEYMKKATDFIVSMDKVSTAFMGLDKRLEYYDANIQKHIELVDHIGRQSALQTEQARRQTELFGKMEETLQKLVDVEGKSLERMKSGKESGFEPADAFKEYQCPKCGAKFSKAVLRRLNMSYKKAMKDPKAERGNICPTCDLNLDLYFPGLL